MGSNSNINLPEYTSAELIAWYIDEHLELSNLMTIISVFIMEVIQKKPLS